MILIPVKNLANAKQRLSAVLDQSMRTELARAMLADMVDAVSECGVEATLVTSDPFALELANQFGFEVIRDDANRSETDAIEMATRVCETRGIDSTLVIPADIPLIEAADIQTIYKHAPKRGSVLAPAADKRGTNAVLRRPSGLFPLQFGNDSFVPHHAAAEATNNPCVVLWLPRIALDIDNQEDLRQLALTLGEKRSQALARRLGFGEAETLNASGSLSDDGQPSVTAKS
jgi:2-phospho-L-lactate/phosphoenolpyruvate guanylyltransferase